MIKRLIMALCIGGAALAATAEAPVKIGVRAGLNTSNISETRVSDGLSTALRSNWKCGFLVGAVVDIPMTHKFYLQPGFFFNHRTNEYATASASKQEAGGEEIPVATFAEGHVTTNWFHIPMLVSYRVGLFDALEVQADFGPYLSYGLEGNDTYSLQEFIDGEAAMESPEISRPSFGKPDGQYFRIDWGFKLGAGIKVLDHYYVGAHYLIGARNLARNRQLLSDAQSHQWQFVIGYDF